ncbi:MAG: translation initiation factor IF-2 [Candidatus Rehaiarchaeum fermentans]|nr:translation initiation factor IF-2 [Candidatus Rehaiarchaeum fermentans]
MESAVCVLLGHADAGKTSILDAIRQTLFAYKESGGLTQGIGATEIPIEKINQIAKDLIEKMNIKVKLNSLIFIDSPGHESFITLREKGASVADLTILVIDINEGLQPQTKESLNVLRKYKTPFIIALTKIDTIPGYVNVKSSDFKEFIENQSQKFQNYFYSRLYQIEGEISELGFKSDLYYQISDFSKTVAIVPVSSKDKVGIADLLVLMIGLIQKYKLNERPNDNRIFFLENRNEKGIGIVTDSIIYSGIVKVGDKMSFVSEGKIVEDSIKSIFRLEPLSETREHFGKFQSVEEIEANAVARISFRKYSPTPGTFGVSSSSKLKEEVLNISLPKYDNNGVCINADTVGSIEALRRLLESRNISIAKEKIGPPSKEDVLAALGSKIIIAFNVEVDKEIYKYALDKGCYIIEGKSIYKIVEDLDKFLEEREKNEIKALMNSFTFPGEIKVLEGFIFRKSKPAIFGVRVLNGIIKKNYTLIHENGRIVGTIEDIQDNKKSIDFASKGMEVAISVDAQFGKDFLEGDLLYNKLSLESIIKIEEILDKLPSDYKEALEKTKKILKL